MGLHLSRGGPPAAPTRSGPGCPAGLHVHYVSRPVALTPPQHRRQLTPVEASELSLQSLDTRTPYVASYSGEDGGNTVHFMFRRVGTTGEKGRLPLTGRHGQDPASDGNECCRHVSGGAKRSAQGSGHGETGGRCPPCTVEL